MLHPQVTETGRKLGSPSSPETVQLPDCIYATSSSQPAANRATKLNFRTTSVRQRMKNEKLRKRKKERGGWKSWLRMARHTDEE